MKKSCLLLLILLLAVTLTACNSTESPNETTPVQTDEAADPVGESDYTGPDFFVAADGDDANDGSAEHPFASFARAQEAVRACRAAESETAVTVTFAEGRYPVAGVVLTAEDGGSESAPVTYRGDGEVVFDAGCTIPADRFSPVTDDAMLARFDETAAYKILV